MCNIYFIMSACAVRKLWNISILMVGLGNKDFQFSPDMGCQELLAFINKLKKQEDVRKKSVS